MYPRGTCCLCFQPHSRFGIETRDFAPMFMTSSSFIHHSKPIYVSLFSLRDAAPFLPLPFLLFFFLSAYISLLSLSFSPYKAPNEPFPWISLLLGYIVPMYHPFLGFYVRQSSFSVFTTLSLSRFFSFGCCLFLFSTCHSTNIKLFLSNRSILSSLFPFSSSHPFFYFPLFFFFHSFLLSFPILPSFLLTCFSPYLRFSFVFFFLLFFLLPSRDYRNSRCSSQEGNGSEHCGA